ncbi:MAG: DUF1223 domain-containing protein [Fimbriimonas sp.]|nr:DUF1223 domain-containing protein [Fimbriimonas sp.]
MSAKSSRPVIVELFTSEGCSDCPPADAVLSRLAATQPVVGAEVIILSQHVDYWNYLGWKDPFSQSTFSDRQNSYTKSFALAGPYTPQMVVDGRSEFVGSDWDRAIRSIDEASRRPKIPIDLVAVEHANGELVLGVEAPVCPVSLELVLAISEDHAQSSVTRGENAGRQLEHTGVVVRLQKLATIPNGQKHRESLVLDIGTARLAHGLHAVVFLQKPHQGLILGAASVKIRRE